MAAAWGAAAEVPKKAPKPGTEVAAPSAAVRSGLFRTWPPVEEKFPGVRAVPFARKKNRRGPSELKVSTGLVAPPVKIPGSVSFGPASQRLRRRWPRRRHGDREFDPLWLRSAGLAQYQGEGTVPWP